MNPGVEVLRPVFCVLPTLVALRAAHEHTHTPVHTHVHIQTFWKPRLSLALEYDLDWNRLRRMDKGLLGKGDVNTEAFYLSAIVFVALGHTTITTLFDSFLLICKDITPSNPHIKQLMLSFQSLKAGR